jgi:predicted enzyme related to lactoylglutathione lyase
MNTPENDENPENEEIFEAEAFESESFECMAPGEIGWSELITSDPEAAIAYYTQLFGWTTEPFPMDQGEYTIFKHDGEPFGGVMKSPRPEVPTHWLNYVIVEDIDDMIARSVELGGSVCLEPMEISGVGRIAVVKDPQGAVIGFHEAPDAEDEEDEIEEE